MTPFIFNIGDRVRLTEPGPRYGTLGVVGGQYHPGWGQIARLRDTLVETIRSPENRYMVQLDGSNPEVEDPALIEEDWLAPIE